MIKYCFVILSILPFGIRQLHAQDKAIWYASLAGYTHGYVSRPEDNENTRAISTRDNTVEKLKSYYNSRGVGFTLERFNPEAQFSFAVGLQYLKAESDIHLPTLRLTDPTFFLVKYREVDTETDYASVLSVYQVGHYMTVPIVAKWFPLNRVRTKLYLMVGGNINFLMRYNTSVNLPNTTLKGFDSLIADQFEAPRELLPLVTVHTFHGQSPDYSAEQEANTKNYLTTLVIPY